MSGLFPDCRKVTIISDLIAKNVSGLDGVSLFQEIQYQILQISIIGCGRSNPYDFVILHVGTHDIDNRAPFDSMISDFGNLIGILKRCKPSIHIIVSANLP